MLQWLRGKRSPEAPGDTDAVLSEALPATEMCWRTDANTPVSYTHLTLPTNREV